MTLPPAAAGPEALRIDRLLVCLRLVRTRSAAEALIASHALRRNRKPVARGAERARVGDVLTLAIGGRVRIIQLLALPLRRGSPAAARAHYRELDAAPPDTAPPDTTDLATAHLDRAARIPIAGVRVAAPQPPALKDLA